MYKKSKKLLAWFLVVSMLLTQMIFTNVAFAASSNRLSGVDRYETALRISQNGWTAGSTEYAVLAYGEDFPDALSAAPLAKKYNAPILLTAKDSLTAGVLDEINRIGAKNVIIVGGEGVVSKAVENALNAAGKTVERLAGLDRYETALKVAEKIGTTDTVALAYGEDYPDALSIAPVAAAKGWPILLTDKDAMNDSVKAYIGSKKVYVVGGYGVVSDAILNSFSNAERVSGMDRYETNLAVMNKFAADLNFGKVFLATGENFADALAGAALAAKTASPVALVGASIAPATEAFLDGKVSENTEVVALGGPAVVSDAAVAAVGGSSSEVLKIDSVTTLTQDGRGIRVAFNKPVANLSSADITVVNKDSRDYVGIEKVTMSSNGMSADIWFLEDQNSGSGYVKEGQTYEITVVAGGSTLTFVYERASYMKYRVSEVNAEDSELTLLAGDGEITLTVPAEVAVDYEEVLGRTVKVWADKDNDVTKIELDEASNEESVKYDAVKFDKIKKEVKLIDEDKSYDLSDDVLVYANGETAPAVDGIAELSGLSDVEYNYGKVVFDKNGDVAFVNAYDWEDFMVVESVDETEVYGYGDELDTEDFIMVKDGKTITAADLEEGDILFYSNAARDNDGYAEVFNKSVTGKIEDITSTMFTVNDEEYKYDVDSRYAKTVQYLDDDKLADVTADIAEDFQDTEEDVTVFVDRNGDAVYVAGDRGDSVKTTVVGFLYKDVKAYTDARSGNLYLPIDMINENGEKVSYDVKLNDLTQGTETNIDKSSVSDGTVVLAKGSLIKVKLNSDGDIAEVYAAQDGTSFAADNFTGKVETTDKYVAGTKVTDDTVVFLVEDYIGSGDEDDIDVIKWGDIEDFSEISQVNGTTPSVVYFNDDFTAKYIIAAETDTDNDSTKTAALITSITKLTTDDVYRIKAIIDGEEKTVYTADSSAVYTYFRDNVLATAQAAIDADGYYAAKILIDDKTGKVVNKTGDDAVVALVAVEAESTVVSRSTANNEITVAGDPSNVTKELADGYKVFDATNSSDIDTYSLQSVKAGDKVVLFYDSPNTNFVKFVVVVDKAE